MSAPPLPLADGEGPGDILGTEVGRVEEWDPPHLAALDDPSAAGDCVYARESTWSGVGFGGFDAAAVHCVRRKPRDTPFWSRQNLSRGSIWRAVRRACAHLRLHERSVRDARSSFP